MAPKYVGPYEILEKKGPNTYKLVDLEGDIVDLVHAKHLKPFFAERSLKTTRKHRIAIEAEKKTTTPDRRGKKKRR